MARYDRIARIPPPPRNECFPGWLALRDIQGREREPELGRRARLRFLALRPLRRLLLRGLDGPSSESLRLQIDGVRAEIEQLDSRDPEREALLEYLVEVGGRSVSGLVAATLDVGAAAETAGHPYAAEEFYRTGLDLAREHGLEAVEVRALRRLARVHRSRGQWEDALALARESAAAADAASLPVSWARAFDEIARTEAARGNPAAARAALREIANRGAAEDLAHVRAIAAAGLCALELATANLAGAVRHGIDAADLFPLTDPHRHGALLDLASAFRRLGLWDAAEACYTAVQNQSTWGEHRAEAAAELAVVAAERGAAAAFRDRRGRVLQTLDSADLRLRALLHLGLGRGCLITGDIDDAREHLRHAISAARDGDLDAVLRRSGELLEVLERGERIAAAAPRPASPALRAAAEALQQRVGMQPVTTG